MRYCNTLLKRYLSVHIPEEELMQAITLKSCEIEEWSLRTVPDLVVIWKIVALERHPQADKLFVCQVDCGKAGTFQICTGGENALVDSYVPVALTWCHLPAINLSIAPRKMRGLDSNGMICSKHELGIPEDTEQHRIWILQYPTDHVCWPEDQLPDMHDITDSDLWIPLKEKYPWMENWMITVENKTITHRPDMFGHFWLANELHAMFGGNATHYTNLSHLRDQLTSTNCVTVLEHTTKSSRNVHVPSDNVRTYATIDLHNVRVQRSDFYIRTLLYDIDLTPKNNRVDFSNLFMYLTGQPIHCFDAATIQWAITVRQATAGEQFIDLQWKEHHLLTSDIVIADEKWVIALAGIMWGARTAVTQATTDIVVEIGNFDPVTVRRTWTRLGLRTDAEIRGEKMINPLFSLAMVPHFMETLHFVDPGQTATFGWITRWADTNILHAMPRIPYERARIQHLLRWASVPADADTLCDNILLHLWCTLGDDRVQAPLWRSPKDLLHTQDLLEEIARIHGYDSLIAQPYADTVDYKHTLPALALARDATAFLRHVCCAVQLETYPWYETDQLNLLSLPTDHLMSMANSLRPEWYYLRDTLIWNLLHYAQKNHYQQPQGSIFDIGQTRDKTHTPHEHTAIALVYWSHSPHTHAVDHPFLTHKWYVEQLLHKLTSIAPVVTRTTATYAHPAQQCTYTIDGQIVARLFTVHPATLLGLRWQEHLCAGAVVAREIDLTALEHANQKHLVESPITTYATLQDQYVTKDLSILVDHHSDIGAYIWALKERFSAITAIELFDVYVGDNIPSDKKSISLRLTILGDGTWTSEQFNSVLQDALTLAQTHGATLR